MTRTGLYAGFSHCIAFKKREKNTHLTHALFTVLNACWFSIKKTCWLIEVQLNNHSLRLFGLHAHITSFWWFDDGSKMKSEWDANVKLKSEVDPLDMIIRNCIDLKIYHFSCTKMKTSFFYVSQRNKKKNDIQMIIKRQRF